MSSSRIFVFSLLVLGFLALLVVAAPECGHIFDGSTPLVDIDRQADFHQLRANWYGFSGATGTTGTSGGTSGSQPLPLAGSTGGSTGGTTGSSSGLTYQIAVISEKQATSAVLRSGANSTNGNRCRSSPGFKGSPDVMNFRTVPNVLVRSPRGFPVNVWKSKPLNLTKGAKYYVVIKVTGNGGTIYTNTDGVKVGVNGTGSEDDDEFPPYKAGLIAMGIAICLLLVLLLLLILVAKGKGEDKYTTTVHRNENVDKL